MLFGKFLFLVTTTWLHLCLNFVHGYGLGTVQQILMQSSLNSLCALVSHATRLFWVHSNAQVYFCIMLCVCVCVWERGERKVCYTNVHILMSRVMKPLLLTSSFLNNSWCSSQNTWRLGRCSSFSRKPSVQRRVSLKRLEGLLPTPSLLLVVVSYICVCMQMWRRWCRQILSALR